MNSSLATVVALALLIGFASKFPQPSAAPRVAPPGTNPRPPPAPPVPQSAWRIEAGPTIHFDPARRYAAVIQLSGVEAFASRDRVAEELHKYAQWEALDVWSDASSVSRNFPRPRGPLLDALGRFFAVGDPSAALTFARPKPIAELWSRAR